MIETRNRLTIRQDWIGNGVIMRFPIDNAIIEVPHDTLVDIIRMTAPYLDTASWQVDGEYSTAHPNRNLRNILSAFAVDQGDSGA